MSQPIPTRAMLPPPPPSDDTQLPDTTIHQTIKDDRMPSRGIPYDQKPSKGTLRGSMRSRLRRQTNVESLRTRDSMSMEPNTPCPGQRPSSSWLQRISISSPPSGSSQSSTCPDSPSMSSSTAQMLPSSVRISSTPAPNKLVKRSTSQRVLSAGNPSRSSGRSPTTPSLRRPATSHQRAATPRHSASYGNGDRDPFPTSHGYASDVDHSEAVNPLVDDVWHPYFTSKQRISSSKSHRKRATSNKQNGESLRRVMAEPENLPTLLLATSVTPEVAGYVPDNGINYSRPDTSPEPAYAIPEHLPPSRSNSGENQNQQTQNHPLPRNRATTSNYASWNIPMTETLRRNRGFSLSHGKGRNVSSHLQQLEKSKTERIIPHSAGLRRRRNITDPSVFQRPMTSTQDEFYSARGNSISTMRPSSESPTPPLPQLSRSEVDSAGEPTPRFPPSNSNTRSFFQLQRNPPLVPMATHPVSYQKPKRFSTAASDPASTLIGSDNDTRVFTSGDEDETDFQSDTAYDSFPNRAMTSSDSVSRGPRIETIFDKASPQLTKGKLAALEHQIPKEPLFEDTYPNTLDLSTDGETRVRSTRSNFVENGMLSFQISPDLAPIGHNKLPVCETPQVHRISEADKGSKACLFDWSEQHTNEKDPQGSDFRPRTVHGKNGANARATRALGRRGPSVLHLRSQSVPVSRESNPPSEAHYPSMKFGTWGLGNKGVSEDWDGDFEFEESDEQAGFSGGDRTDLTTFSQGMKVPQAIMERQASVHGQFGHVKELTLLVGELRRLRLQANALRLTNGPSNELWKEAEGIINLATLDDDESAFNPPRSPSSPTLNLDWCDEESPRSKKGKRQGSHDSDLARSPLSVRTNPSPNTTPPRRPRSGSSAKVKSVLETIYQQRRAQDPVQIDTHTHPQQRLPFDTQSLRDLVVRAGAVTRALKEIVRKAESVSPDSDHDPLPQDPPFSQIFTQPQNGSPTFHGSNLPNSKSVNGYLGNVPPTVANENDIAGHMKMMTVV